MKLKLLVYIYLCLVLLLSACGGGSSGSNTNSQATNQSTSESSPDESPPAENTLPTIKGEPVNALRAGKAFQFIPQVTDDDGDVLTFSIMNKPEWMVFNQKTGELSGSPINSDAGVYPDIIISVHDGKNDVDLPPFTITVLLAQITQEHIATEGTLTSVLPQSGNGLAYLAEGKTVINTGMIEQPLENSRLHLEYDEEGNLVDLFGDTDLPPALSHNLAINSQVSAKIGMYKGSEINALPEIDIILQDDIDYFVFFVGTSTDITVGDSEDGFGESLTLEPPLSGQILFISDPTDVFYYYYASIPLLGEAGYGRSIHGLIPFVPQEDYPELDLFEGHTIEKASFGIGFKVFDFFELSGTRVIREPELGDINWEKPLQSELEYKAGLNGDASFAFSILSVGLFEFDLATASASFDVGLDRQHFAMQTTIAPDVSWQPEWFPILPETEIVGNWVIDGSNGFAASLSGAYRSTLPEAELLGTMKLGHESVTFTASIPDAQIPLTMSATFANNETVVELLTEVDVTSQVTGAVTQELDKHLANIEQAIEDLSNAISDYEIEVSLRGLRSALPAVSDTAIDILNVIPDEAYSQARSNVINYVRNYEICVPAWPLPDICSNPLNPLVDEVAVGTAAGNRARNEARDIVNPIICDLEELKSQAQQADNEQLRAALETALRRVYDNRIINQTISISVDFPLVGNRTVYSRTVNQRVIPADMADQVLFAANNVYRIQETSDIVFNTSAIVDALPTEEVINRVKEEVENGLALIPVFNGAGYTISGNNYIAHVLLGDKKYDVAFNVLDPAELLQGIGDLIASPLLE